MPRRFPIRIPRPCDASWDDMTGEGAQRHCGRCSEDVHDLLSLPAARAQAVLESGACLRIDLRSAAAAAVLALATAGCATLPLTPIEVTPLSAPYNGEPVPAEADDLVIDLQIEDFDLTTCTLMGRRGN